ncbi:MAG: mechanosensitive ion channel family protein, partial [Myxococcales bacterium]|nr:mechanosensitive ion channel family protein [Myxococcales bacterium]
NSAITNANIDNYGRRRRRRVKTVLGLTYDTPPDKLQAFVEGVRAILAAHPAVQKTYEVHFHDFGASSLDVLVYYHLVVPDWHAELTARSQNFLEFLRLAQELGVSFAFPSTSLYVESTPEQPLADHPERTLEQLVATVAQFGPGGRLARPGGPAFAGTFDPGGPAVSKGTYDDGGSDGP